ncbi:vWA domain-containing protein [Marilutibacter aestuarii]|uniref:VWA domain-containing protein n=1 Tax=Marilutibacter aestuarii TaxID=1706195 RepID=A0A508AFL6_9GAMM|nr:VWA domain-containing protein [Lysobacter aestuarii]TQD45895.1 VWA domain-containing protein [Lysobacter aestuarii]
MNRTFRRTALAAGIAALCLAAGCTQNARPPEPDMAREQAMAERKSAEVRTAARSELDAVSRGRVVNAPPPMPMMAPPPPPAAMYASMPPQPAHGLPAANTETYAGIEDNPVHRTVEEPVSTFSIDVDTGSYTNVRGMLADGTRPPANAVRAEEFLNYFDYGHPAPTSRQVPFRVSTELAPAPWNAKRQLLMIGIKGYEVPKATLPPANLVFLIDTSGSMNSPDKLPLLKRAFSMLTRQLRPQDRVSIVVYAGSAGLVLPPTPGDRQGEILAALEQLSAGGSTNGGEGIQLAYAMARQGFVKDGVNRVILATDGDFNVGTIDRAALETLVGDQRSSGVALSTLGFGRGNYNDAMAERLADVGDGNHAYIDSLHEARKVLVEEMGSTLLTIARDVKIQVEFNPARVAEYRLVGYENRVLAREDFDNDQVDAGDIGAGHEVTALYEITPVGAGVERLPALRYGKAAQSPQLGSEVAHLRLRYKRPGEDDSRLIETPIRAADASAGASPSLRFAASVAAFADLLRGGTHFDGWGWDAMLANARAARGDDRSGQRSDFIAMAETARTIVAPAGADGAPRVSE